MNAHSSGTCWSSSIPMRRASGSVFSSRLAAGSDGDLQGPLRARPRGHAPMVPMPCRRIARRISVLPAERPDGREGCRAEVRVELSIVMPCRDEAETLERCVAKARRYLDSASVDGEIIVVDNGSTDGSGALARRLGVRVVEVADPGYGSALLGGILAARGTFVVMGDADDSYDFSDLEPFVTALRGGADLVMGDRFAGGIEEGAMPALHRYVGNPALSFLGRLFFRSDIRDFHCGLRAFRRDAILALDLQSPGMEFASEMVVKATLSGLNVTPGADPPVPRRPQPPAPPAHLARRLAPPPLPAPLQPALAVLLPGAGAPARRRRGGRGADVHGHHDRRRHVQHRDAGGLHRPGAHRLPVDVVRAAVEVLRQPGGPAPGRSPGRRLPPALPARGRADPVGGRGGGRRGPPGRRGGRVGLQAARPRPARCGRSCRR